MEKLKIDFDEIQKAMEDISREAFDYFLDIQTGDLIILSEDIIARAQTVLDESIDEDMEDYDEVEFDEDQDIPDWMEEEIELAVDIFLHEKDRYARIPERNSGSAYAAMKGFTEGLEDTLLQESLTAILDGKGAFRKFKAALESHPKERKMWYGYNAKAAKLEIEAWLKSLGIECDKRPVTSDL